jgi:hypothetical protein
MYDNFTSSRVHRWRLYIEEFGPDIRYIKGEANVVADALSHLDTSIPAPTAEDPRGTARDNQKQPSVSKKRKREDEQQVLAITQKTRRLTRKAQALIEEKLAQTDSKMPEFDAQSSNDKPATEPATRTRATKRKRQDKTTDAIKDDELPITYEVISKYQWQDTKLCHKAETDDRYSVKQFGKYAIIFRKNLIPVPTVLRKPIIEWYHTNLCHPGFDRTEQTIRRNFTWKNLREDVRDHVKYCDACQRLKRHTKKYGHLPAKKAETKPWKQLCVDLIGPYKVQAADGKIHELLALTMIDPATSWFEIKEIPNKTAETVALLVDREWFCRYPRPTYCTFDQGGEFTGHEFQELLHSYGITPRPASSRNPQANSVLERVHLTLHNLLRTFELQQQTLDPMDPWSGFLAATAYAIRSTYHTTLQATPAELVFGRDMLFNREFQPNWEEIRRRKQQLIDDNNRRENAKRIKHTYSVGDQVLYRLRDSRKHHSHYDGPFTIVQTYTNGQVKIRRHNTTQKVNIRLLHPYYER